MVTVVSQCSLVYPKPTGRVMRWTRPRGDVTEFCVNMSWIFGEHGGDPQAAQKAIETLVQVFVLNTIAW
jgi:hypothetical protein